MNGHNCNSVELIELASIYTKLKLCRFPLVGILNQHEMAIIVISFSRENSTNSLELTELSSINKVRSLWFF
jgi:hypothetical protein